VTASSGDGGFGSEYPASSPYVVAVGGTTLQLFTDNTYSAESVWSGTGSGCSGFETANAWQLSLSNWGQTHCGTFRSVSDVSAVADPNTGVAIYDSTPYSGQTGGLQVGGTSLASPIIAAAYALAGGVPANTNASSIPYKFNTVLNFHDVTTGSHGSCGTSICLAGIGYDGPSGIGSLNGLAGVGGVALATPTPTLTPSPTVTPIVTPSPILTLTPTVTPTPTLGDTQAPTVSITNPANGATVVRNNNVTIRVTAADNVKVTKVEFNVNGVLRSSSTTSHYRHVWRVPSPRNVTYTLSAKAYDAAGNTSTSVVTVTSR